MEQSERKSKCALVTPSGKQILLHNDLEKVFNVYGGEASSPSRQWFGISNAPRNSNYLFQSPGDLDFRSYGSPALYQLNLSPARTSTRFGVQDTLAWRVDALKPSTHDSGDFDQQLSSSLPEIFSRSSHSPQPRELLNDRLDQNNEDPSPLMLEILPISINQADRDDFHRQPNGSPDLIEQFLIEKDMTRLKCLYKILLQVFTQHPINVEEYSQLSQFEEELLNSILQRKFAKKLRLRDFELEPIKRVDLINEIIATKSHKRPEECYKFVLTRVIKHLKKCLKNSYGGVKDSEAFFYEYYFGKTAESMNRPITDFHYPLTGKKGKFKLNSKYFQRIFKSQSFVSGMYSYLRDHLEQEYRAEISKKLESLLLRWDELLMNSGPNSQNVEAAVKEYLLKNKRCKLPWTMYEVQESIEKFKNLLRNLDSSSNN